MAPLCCTPYCTLYAVYLTAHTIILACSVVPFTFPTSLSIVSSVSNCRVFYLNALYKYGPFSIAIEVMCVWNACFNVTVHH